MRPITRLTTAILSGLLILLGFGGCRSSKHAAEKTAEAARAARAADEARLDSLRRALQGPQKNIRPDDLTRLRVLYAPPPARYRKDIK